MSNTKQSRSDVLQCCAILLGTVMMMNNNKSAESESNKLSKCEEDDKYDRSSLEAVKAGSFAALKNLFVNDSNKSSKFPCLLITACFTKENHSATDRGVSTSLQRQIEVLHSGDRDQNKSCGYRNTHYQEDSHRVLYSLPDIASLPHELCRNLSNSIMRLVDARVRSYLKLMLHYCEDLVQHELDASRPLTALTIIENAESYLQSAVTVFQGDNVIAENEDSVELEITFKTAFDTILLGVQSTLSMTCKGILKGVFDNNDNYNNHLLFVTLELDTDELLQNMKKSVCSLVDGVVKKLQHSLSNLEKVDQNSSHHSYEEDLNHSESSEVETIIDSLLFDQEVYHNDLPAKERDSVRMPPPMPRAVIKEDANTVTPDLKPLASPVYDGKEREWRLLKRSNDAASVDDLKNGLKRRKFE